MLQILGVTMLSIGLLLAILMSYRLFHEIEYYRFGDLGFVIVGLAVQLFGIGCLIIGNRN